MFPISKDSVSHGFSTETKSGFELSFYHPSWEEDWAWENPGHLASPIIITHPCSRKWQCGLPFSCLWCSLLAVAIYVPSATLLRGLSTYRKQRGGHLIHSQCLEPSIACSTSLTHFSIRCPPYKDAVRIKMDSSLTVLAGNAILCMSSCFVLLCQWWYQKQECH